MDSTGHPVPAPAYLFEPSAAAEGLPDRASFVLNHCGRSMTRRSTVTQRRGGVGETSETTSVRMTCDGCAATLELHLTERPL